MELTILYWNMGGKWERAEYPLRTSRAYDLVAVQEPGLNPYLKCPKHTRGGDYHMDWGGGRAVLYVHKRHSVATWTWSASKDWCSATFGKGPSAVTVYSIYSEGYKGGEWHTPLHELSAQEPGGRNVLVGDFNLHHPLWDTHERYQPQAEALLALAQRWNLSLATPRGEIIRERFGFRDSTIDHAWVGTGLEYEYWGREEEVQGSDHYAQVVTVKDPELRQQDRAAPMGWSWSKMDRKAVEDSAVHIRPVGLLQSPEDLDEAVAQLTEQLSYIADASMPRKKPLAYGRQVDWWDRDVDEAVRATRRAQRQYRAMRSQHHWENLQQAASKQGATIRRAKTKAWRKRIMRASGNPKEIWALERWARLRSHTLPEQPTMPELRRSAGDEYVARTHSEKAALLAEKFFPDPEADLDDIGDTTFGDHTFGNTFEIDWAVDSDDIALVLKRAGPWKAPGYDLFPNGFLKACGPPLYEALAAIATASFRIGYFPSCFRRANVVVLQKPGKSVQEYQTVGGWRPVSLLCAIGKAIEAVVGMRIAKAAEEQRLLPEGQMGNRKDRNTELAIRVVTEAVYSSWKRRAVASLLQLDIKGAFDTVNHIRLLDTI